MSSSGNRKKIVFVLGTHRSGTSLTAELVSGLGYAVPGELLDSIGEVNARGFWESKEVVALNERLLDAANLKWFHVCPVGHFYKAVSPDALREISRDIKVFIDTELEKHGQLVIKDPRLCILFKVWLSVIDRNHCDVKILFINRHPAAVAGSLQARDGFSLFSGHLLWMYYFFSVFSREFAGEALYLNYENILSDPHSCGAIISFLGVGEVDGEAWLRTIDSSLQRNFSAEFPDSGHVYSLAKYFYIAYLHGAVVTNSEDVVKGIDSFESFIFTNNDFVYALNESNNNISGLRKELIAIGEMHTHALHVIKEKDALLQEKVEQINAGDTRAAELQLVVAQAKDSIDALQHSLTTCGVYIAECEARIFDLEFAVGEFSAVRERIASLEKLIAQRNAEALRNEAYIARLDARIAELHEAVTEFEALRERISQIEAALQQKNRELDGKTRAVAGAEQRIIELDQLFVGQRANYLSALGVIDELEKKLTTRNDEFFCVADELSEVKERLDSLLSWRVVRVIDRQVSKGES